MIQIRYLLAVVLLCASWMVRAQDGVHQGPALNIWVQRGDQQLPLALVNRLRQGDRVQVQPDVATLAKGDWVLLLARVSPTGNQVASQFVEVADLTEPATLEITADDQAPVIVLAPQLRNLFGLYTSLRESAGLLNEVLRADPQRFYDLQKVDQINQAIQAIGQGLARRVSGRQPQQAIQAARELAAKFGVNHVDPECFRNERVNTECVATDIVANKDFALPSNQDLSGMVGNKRAVDLSSFLLSNLRMFSEASDYLSNKYRDNYDFAPTFGRRHASSARIELFSMARFRNGSIKTAYIYVPSWFTGRVPELLPLEREVSCVGSGRLGWQVRGRLPLLNLWHDWHLVLSLPDTDEALVELTDLSFDPETGVLNFDPASLDMARLSGRAAVQATLSGRFGFEAVTLPPVPVALAWTQAQDLQPALQGVNALMAGERATLTLADNPRTACVRGLSLQLHDGTQWRSDAGMPTRLALDLREVIPGSATLTVQQAGVPDLTVPLRVQAARARITRIEHAQWDEGLSVSGARLDRIAQLQLGEARCAVDASASNASGTLYVTCPPGLRDNAQLPGTVTVWHRDDEPAPQTVPLSKTPARPKLVVAEQVPNALVVNPSPKALQWGLSPTDALITDDSGLSLLLQAQAPYTLSKGQYSLQLRFQDDPPSANQPLSVPLIADLAHNELRTRSPVRFAAAELPGVVNPLEYRVQHQPSGLNSHWLPLPRSVLLLPELSSATCSPPGDAVWVAGSRLDLIDAVRPADTPDAAFAAAPLVSCPQGLCLSLPASTGDQLDVRVRWVDGRVFRARLPGKGCASARP